MKYLWELPHHRQEFTELATEALSNMESARPPLFLRFVNLLINDAIYLLDEGLSYMSQLRESQKERSVCLSSYVHHSLTSVCCVIVVSWTEVAKKM